MLNAKNHPPDKRHRGINTLNITVRIGMYLAAAVTLTGAAVLGAEAGSAQAPADQISATSAVQHGADHGDSWAQAIPAAVARRQGDGFGREVFVANCAGCHRRDWSTTA